MASRFLIIGAVLLILGVVAYYTAQYKYIAVSGSGPMITSHEDWLRRQESYRAMDAQYHMISTIGQLLMICSAVSFGITAFITVKPLFKKP